MAPLSAITNRLPRPQGKHLPIQHAGRLYCADLVFRQKVSERRLSTLLSLSEQTAKARDMDAFWMLLLRTLESNDKDIPFALLYSVEDIDDSNDASSVSTQSSISPRQCILKGAIGVPDDHPAAPARLDLQEGYNGFLPYFRVAMKSKKPTVFRIDDGTIPDYLTKDISWRGFGDKCSSLVISRESPQLGSPDKTLTNE